MFGEMSCELMDECIHHFGSDEYQELIQEKILDPIVAYILGKLQPYLITTILAFFILLMLLIVVTIMVVRKN